MSKIWRVIVGSSLILGALPGPSRAETLLGKNHVGGSFAIIQFGDDVVDDVFGNGYGFGVSGNINLDPNIDLQLGVGYLWADGEQAGIEVDLTSLSGRADLVYFFKPNEEINPYIGAGLAIVESEQEVSGFGLTEDEDDTEVGFGGEVGVELEFTEKVLFKFSVGYFHIDSEDDVSLNGGFGYWLNEQVLGTVRGSYWFDSEDAIAQGGLIFKL